MARLKALISIICLGTCHLWSQGISISLADDTLLYIKGVTVRGSLICNTDLLPYAPSGMAFTLGPDIGAFCDSTALLKYNLSGSRCFDFLTLTSYGKAGISSGVFFIKRPETKSNKAIADFSFQLEELSESDTIVEITCLVTKSSGIDGSFTGDSRTLFIRHVPPAESFTAYYDPLTKSVRVRVPDTGAENLRVTIYDLTGRIRKTQRVISDMESIGCEGLESGVYLAAISFQLSGRLFRHTSKIIIP